MAKSSTSVAEKASKTKIATPKAKTEKVKGEPKKVGYEAKTLVDCAWNSTRVAFYEALRKIGRGTAKEISAASGGAVTVGNCLHYGYHGVKPGYNKIEAEEEKRGFVFVLLAKGKNLNLTKMLEAPKKSD